MKYQDLTVRCGKGINMTRKRFVKLLMAKGVSKRMAEERAIICSVIFKSYSKSCNNFSFVVLPLIHKKIIKINREKAKLIAKQSLKGCFYGNSEKHCTLGIKL